MSTVTKTNVKVTREVESRFKKTKSWSTSARAGEYKRLVNRIVVLVLLKERFALALHDEIPAGDTVNGVQHSLVKRRSVLDEEIKRLGYFDEVRSDKIDGKKVGALVKLHPELSDVVYAEEPSGHRLVVRENHK